MTSTYIFGLGSLLDHFTGSPCDSHPSQYSQSWPGGVLIEGDITPFPGRVDIISLTKSKSTRAGSKHRSLLTSAHPVSIPCTFSTETTVIFYFPSSAGHLLLHLVAACPPIILLVTSEWFLFNHPIFLLVIPLTTSLLVSYPYSAPPGSVTPSIPVLFKTLCIVLPSYPTYFSYTTPYPCPQYYLTRSSA